MKSSVPAAAYGLGQKTGIELPGEVAGVAPSPKWKLDHFPDNPWSIGDTVVTAIGQGYDTVTPLQLVNVTAAVANGGTLFKPQLVLRVTDPSGTVRGVPALTVGARLPTLIVCSAVLVTRWPSSTTSLTS